MVFKYTIVFITLMYSAWAYNHCCNDTQNIIHKGKCIDGKSITGIQCQRRYIIQPEETGNFTFGENGILIIDQDMEVDVNDYCIATEKKSSTVAALICLSEDSENNHFFLLRSCCAFLSVTFLILTVIVYALVPSLRDLQGKCLLHMITALTIAMLVLGLMQTSMTIHPPGCAIVGFISFAAFLATFTWLNVIAFHIWKSAVMPTCLGTNKQWYLIYCAYGYGIPFIIVVTTIICHNVSGSHIKPGIEEYSCWFSSDGARWAYFYGPISFFLLLNIFFFIWTTKALWNNNSSPKIRAMKYKCLMYIKLFFIMGLSWIFEILSFAFPSHDNFMYYVWLVIDFINALQGILIFFILVVLRKKALQGLATRGLFCIQFPQQWKTLQDEECDDEAEEDRLAADAPQQVMKYPKENQSFA